MITIDGNDYNVDVLSLKRKAEFLDKYANRTEDGDLKRELIGVYYNYQLAFGPGTDQAEYNRLWDKLTEPEEFHAVTVPTNTGSYSFTAYFASIADELVTYGNEKIFKGLTVHFIAKTPARR